MRYVLLAALLCLPLSVIGQDDKDILRKRDKHRDIDTITTKPNDVLATSGKLRTVVSMIPVAVIEKNAARAYVALVFDPQAVTIAGRALQSAAETEAGIRQSNSLNPGRVYFQPTAEAILLVNKERVTLPPADKITGLSGSAEYRGRTIVAVPVDWFHKLAASDQWSILIGDVVVGVGDPDLSDAKRSAAWAERVQPRLRAFASAIKKL